MPQKSVQLSDFPEVNWLPAGILLREDKEPQDVLVCGGFTSELTDKVGLQ